MGRSQCSVSSRAGHVTTEIVHGQTLALWLGDRDEHCPLESDITGLNVKGNLYLYLLKKRKCLFLIKATLNFLINSDPKNNNPVRCLRLRKNN